MIVAGIDEAGYGPLLGPLVVSAAAFELPGALPEPPEDSPCLWKLLRDAVTKKLPPKRGRLLIADSKMVHPLTDGDKHLERAVLTVLTVLGRMDGISNAWELLAAMECPPGELAIHPWYAIDCLRWPWLCEKVDVAIASNMLRAAMAKAGIKPAGLHTRLVPESAFNALVASTNNKASVLVSLTLQHAGLLLRRFPCDDMLLQIDKQGGRDHYTELLLRSFPEASLRVLRESRHCSSYELLYEGRRAVLVFQEKSETHSLPAALASMTCKYLRELFMHGFNGWWCGRVEGLKPTAGYYLDGQRWVRDVQPHLERLGVRAEQFVRLR